MAGEIRRDYREGRRAAREREEGSARSLARACVSSRALLDVTTCYTSRVPTVYPLPPSLSLSLSLLRGARSGAYSPSTYLLLSRTQEQTHLTIPLFLSSILAAAL